MKFPPVVFVKTKVIECFGYSDLVNNLVKGYLKYISIVKPVYNRYSFNIVTQTIMTHLKDMLFLRQPTNTFNTSVATLLFSTS